MQKYKVEITYDSSPDCSDDKHIKVKVIDQYESHLSSISVFKATMLNRLSLINIDRLIQSLNNALEKSLEDVYEKVAALKSKQ